MLVPYEGRFGDLKFGAPLEDAMSFGRPVRFRWIQKDYCELLYARRGFQIDFEDNRFASAAFFMDQHVAEPDVAGGFDPALLNLVLRDDNIGELSRRSTRDVITGYFGSPSQIDSDTDETILTFEVAGLTLEFEMHPKTNTLMRFNIYPI